jgi:hypothetical protein
MISKREITLTRDIAVQAGYEQDGITSMNFIGDFVNVIKDMLQPGSTKTYVIKKVEYDVTLRGVSGDGSTASFEINGEKVDNLKPGELRTLADGMTTLEVISIYKFGDEQLVNFFMGRK